MTLKNQNKTMIANDGKVFRLRKFINSCDDCYFKGEFCYIKRQKAFKGTLNKNVILDEHGIPECHIKEKEKNGWVHYGFELLEGGV